MWSSGEVKAELVTESRGVVRYLAGQLSAEEVAEFETYMLEHPEFLDEIDVARRLKLGLKSLREKGEIEGLVSGNAAAMRNRYFAMAASVLVAVGLGSWFLAQRGADASAMLAASIEGFGKVGSTALIDDIMLVQNRASDSNPLEIPPTPTLFRLQIITKHSSPGVSFDAQLLRGIAGQAPVPLRRLENLRPDADGIVALYLDPRAAGPGTYLVRLESRPPTEGEAYEYRLDLK
jgi:hypothetical protein